MTNQFSSINRSSQMVFDQKSLITMIREIKKSVRSKCVFVMQHRVSIASRFLCVLKDVMIIANSHILLHTSVLQFEMIQIDRILTFLSRSSRFSQCLYSLTIL